MQNPSLTHENFSHCLNKIGLTSSGHLQFSDGPRTIDLSDVTEHDMSMISHLCHFMTGDLTSSGELISAA